MKLSRNLLLLAATGLAMTGCIDDKYDLSDIDTNVKVPVDNLTVPINIDEITLSNVFDLKKDSKIKEINGEYAFVEEGKFNSKDVNIPSIHAASPDINPTVVNISIPSGLPATLPAGQTLTFDIGGESTQFTASTSNVSSSIVKITSAGTHFELDITIAMTGLEGKVKNLRLHGLEMRLPKGLVIQDAGTRYNPATGIYNVGDVETEGASIDLHYIVTQFDFDKAGVTYNYDTHFMSFSDQLSLSKAVLVINSSDLLVPTTSLPSRFTLTTSFKMSDIDITTFSGRIKYDIEGFEITDVNLTDLPDILTQTGTDIRIANPQIYVALTNPLHDYKLTARTGIEITSFKDNNAVGTYKLDAPGYFVVNGTPGVLDYKYYLSPSAVANTYPGYNGATHVGYSSLSDVLSGDGIPTRLKIDFIDPCVPEQDVTGIRLGRSLGKVNGNYTFFAPLALKAGSTIVYSDVLDGWSSEDLDAVTIESLSVSLTISTDVPIALDFTGYPIDKDGKQINNVTIEGAQIDANANNQQVTLRISGAIRGLDGIRFTARASAAADEGALKPDMSIKLSNVRPTVSGYYEKEL